MQKSECTHYQEQAKESAAPRSNVCETCGISGPLRVCMTCGYVGCCESRNSHDTMHWRETGHAIIRALPLTEKSFTWCYEHQAYLK
jgi:CPA1 family monovalent cation:H+ antiporter